MLQHLPRDDWPFDGGGPVCVQHVCVSGFVHLRDTGGLNGHGKIVQECVKVQERRRGGKIKGPHLALLKP